jgi:ABC-type multidrug transport system fused ATPase/permease subunit
MAALIRLFRFLHESRGMLTASFIFLLASTGLMLVQPLMIEYAIDHGIEAGSASLSPRCWLQACSWDPDTC